MSPSDLARICEQAQSVPHAAQLAGLGEAKFRSFAAIYEHPDGGTYLDFLINKKSRDVKLTRGFFTYDRMAAILRGDTPNTLDNLVSLKRTLLHHGFFADTCQNCGFEGKRSSDFQSPIIVDFLDDDSSNGKQENIQLLCFNCAFLYGVDYRRLDAQRDLLGEPEEHAVAAPTIDETEMQRMISQDPELEESMRNMGLFG